MQHFSFILLSVTALPRSATATGLTNYTDARSQWMLNLTHVGVAIEEPWPALSAAEIAELDTKAAGWLKHAVDDSISGHVQWGQAIPQLIYANPERTVPLRYDDLGDTAAWTGQLLSAIAHKYGTDGDSKMLKLVDSILQAFNRSVGHCTSSVGYIPRTWALPANSSKAFSAWASYYSSPPFVNGNGSHNVFSCTATGAEHWLWQGDASRDTYIGSVFGLGSVLLALKSRPAAAQQYALAQFVFELVFDKLAADRFFILHPKECVNKPKGKCLPVNPTPTMAAMLIRVAISWNPDKYSGFESKYEFWLNSAISSEHITPIHHASYYGNNLLSECWYLIARLEQQDQSKEAAQRWPKLAAKIVALLTDYAPHLQAPLPAYWLAATNFSSSPSTQAPPQAPPTALWDSIVESTLWDFPAAPNAWHAVDQHNNSIYGVDVKCAESSGCSTTAILVRDRPSNEFVWQIDPTKLASRPSTPPETQPQTEFGGAFVTPYYIWRSAGRF